MRLRTRLFLFLGVLILAICIILYIVPEFLAESHVEEDRKRYLAEVEMERRASHDRIDEWLSGQIGKAEGVIDAYLFLVHGHPALAQALMGTDDPSPGRVWLPATQLLAYSDELDFVQVNHLGDLDAAITLSNARLYRSRLAKKEDGFVWVVLDEGLGAQRGWSEAYIGIWFPKEFTAHLNLGFQPELETPHTLLLFDPLKLMLGKGNYAALLKEQDETMKPVEGVENAAEITKRLLTSLDDAHTYLQKEFGGDKGKLETFLARLKAEKGDEGDAPPVERVVGQQAIGAYAGRVGERSTQAVGEASFAGTLSRQLRRTNDLELIGALGFLASIDVLWATPFAEVAPVGSARIEPAQSIGTGILASDVFANQPLWDGAGWLKSHPPIAGRVPVGSDFGLLKGKERGDLTVVNTMELLPGLAKEQGYPPSFLTLGVSLRPLVTTLAQITGDTNLLVFEGELLLHVSDKEGGLSEQVQKDIQQQVGQLQKPTGFVNLGGEDFYYSRYQPKPEWDLYFVTLEPAEQVLRPIEEFEARSKEMVRRLTFHFILIAIGVLLIALILLELIVRRFTRPITKLARATEDVAAGHYEHIELPKVKAGSKNEIAVLTESFDKMIHGLQDREKIRGVLDKVVSKEIAEEILHGNVALGGEVREVCVLFADIRNFTQITANLPPEEVITFVNAYMNEMTQIIEIYQGVIDKYVGDEVMALFGAPVSHPYAPLQAVLAAITIRDKLTQWNEERKAQGLFTCHVGIGIHYGPMVAGNMGAEDRLNYTVLGSNVNLASRLCDDAREKEILISETMAHQKQIQDTMVLSEKESMRFKGFAEPMTVYRVEGIKPNLLLGRLSEMARERGAEPSV
ncbi:MAG: adenylate/guanylate cyclase domain-containing protein [Parachlamydiales bacterium]